MDGTEFIALALAGTAALALFVLALAALAMLAGSRRAARDRRRAAEPDVLVHVRQDPDSPTVLQIVIENLGGSVAKDVRFKLNRPIPVRAFGLTEDDAAKRREPDTTSDLLAAPIPALSPGATRVMDWGQYGGLHRAIGDRSIKVTARFRNQRGRKRSARSRLEVASFYGLCGSDRGPIREVAKVLGKIDRTMCSLNANVRPLRIKPAGESSNGSGRTRADAGDALDIFVEPKPDRSREGRKR